MPKKPSILNKGYRLIEEYLISKRKYGKNPYNASIMREIEKVSSFISSEPIARLIYVLYKVEFSNQYEIELLGGVKHSSILHYFQKMQKMHIVEMIPRSSKDFKIATSFWKFNRPKSSKDNLFYFFDTEFMKIIEYFLPLLDSYFTNNQIALIEERRQKWLAYKDTIEKQVKAHEMAIKNAIGCCSNPSCKKLIGAGSVEDKDYYQYSRKHRLCRECHINRKVEAKTIKEWLKER